MKSSNAIEMLVGLAQETRLAVFRLLVEAGPQGLAAGDIATALAAAPATLSFHLAHLRHARLIKMRREGRMIFYSADYNAMNALMAYLTENCCRGDAACATKDACARGSKEQSHETSARTRRRARPR